MEVQIPETVGPYKIVSKIGTGTFAKVYQGYDKANKKLVALKFLSKNVLKNPQVFDEVHNEIEMSEIVKHQNIVSLDDVRYLEDFVVLIMECLGNGTIVDLKELSIFKIEYPIYIKWAKDILNGLKYLHSMKISHHDIKPENIGFDSYNNAKILDLGTCERFKDYCCCKNCTPIFSSPELLWDEKFDGTKSDIWSFGVTFHYMVTGTLPYSNISQFAKIENKNDLLSLLNNYCSEPFKQIVDLALTIDPNKRPSAEELLQLDIFNEDDK